MEGDKMKRKFDCIPKLGIEQNTGRWFVIADYIKHRNGVVEIVKDYDVTDQVNEILKQQAKLVNDVMNYSFPLTKWVKTATASQQLTHINSEVQEMNEAYTAESGERVIEEAMDLYHSLETYFRILDRGGININEYRQMVQAKNEARGYYAD
jgi:uncharacterized protein YukE